jgi:hypothetical protein
MLHFNVLIEVSRVFRISSGRSLSVLKDILVRRHDIGSTYATNRVRAYNAFDARSYIT